MLGQFESQIPFYLGVDIGGRGGGGRGGHGPHFFLVFLTKNGQSVFRADFFIRLVKGVAYALPQIL